MKRYLVSAAALPLLFAAAAQADTAISTATTAPVRTSTAAGGQPDSLTITAAGSIAPTTAGAAVTVDSSHNVTNNGAITYTGVSGATGILVNGGLTSTVLNTGAISLLEDFTGSDTDSDGDIDGGFAQGSGRFAIRAIGPGALAGSIAHGGTISVEGNDSAGISVETRLGGALAVAGSVQVVGDRGVGIRADSVAGDVQLLGAVNVQGENSVAVLLGDVDGAVVLQNTIASTGYRAVERAADADRAKLDADDLKQGGAAVRITGSVGRGVLLDRPPTETNADDADEDKDGVADATEATSTIVSYAAAPALDIGGPAATTLGAIGTGDLAYGLVNRGAISGLGVNDGVSATALRIGQAGGGVVTVAGGVHNQGGTMLARAYGAQATAVLINPNAVVTTFRNSGTVSADQQGGLHDGRALVDLSGTLTDIENTGVIAATVTAGAGVTRTGRAIAVDLSANTTGVFFRQIRAAGAAAPSLSGDVLFGSGADRLELLGGTYAGTLDFGAGVDTLIVDGGAIATANLADTDGSLVLFIGEGALTVANAAPVNIGVLNVAAKGVLGVTIDPAAASTRFNVSGPATIATGAQIDVNLAGLSRGTKSYQILQAGSLSVGQAGVTLAGSPFLYQAALRADAAGGALFVDLRPKTAAELGLNRSGAQAYAAVFESLDRDDAIEQAFLAQDTQAGFQGLYDQMLPDHSGGTLMSAQAVSRAVSQAVAEPQRIDRNAATGVWASEVVFQIERDRADASGFKSQGFGLAAGIDMQGERNALGFNASLVTVDVKDRGAAANEQVTMNMVGTGLYWRFDGGPLQATARGGLGYVFFDGDRRLVGAGLDLKAKADWGGWVADAYAQASYEWRAGAFYARPEASVSYLRLSEKGYAEKGASTGFNLTVDDRKGDLMTGEALVAVGWRFGDEVYLAPEIKAGYRTRIAGSPGRTTAHFEGGADFTLDAEDPFKGGAVVRAGLRGGASKVLYAVTAGALYDKDYKEYDVRAVVRFQF